MRAVVLAGVGDVRLEEVPDARVLESTDALVAVRAAAICGADLFPLHGLTPGFENGTILGHEFAGVLVDRGDAVTTVEIGRRVTNTSMVADGTCPACRAGRTTQCTGRALFGYSGVYPRLDGGQAELVRVPHADRVLAPLPDEVSDDAAIFLADNLPTAYDAVVTRGGVREGDFVCVVGLGAVGLMSVMCAVDAGARVLAVDGVEARRATAVRLGAETVAPEDALEAVVSGKILRMTPEGRPAPGNPFGNFTWSFGHRNPQGLAWDATGDLWAAEFGQNTWDELNRITRGANYGWPIVEGQAGDARFVDPAMQWSTADASPSGLAIVGDTLFLAALRGERLWAIAPATSGAPLASTPWFTGELGRLRDVTQGPDDELWFIGNNTDGRGAPSPGDDRLFRVHLAPA